MIRTTSTSTIRRYLLVGLTVSALLLLGCGSDSGASETATGTPVATATGTASPASDRAPTLPDRPPSTAAVFALIEGLAGDIGIRAAGTEGSRDAAEFIRRTLEDAGYVVALEAFETTAAYDDSSFTAGERSFAVFALNGSANARASGRLVLAGIGTEGELAELDVDGAIVVVDRGIIPFSEKATNAQAAGAAGLVVINIEDGPLFGTLGDVRTRIPVVGVELNTRAELHDLIETGVGGSVAADAGTRQVSSQNVVATNGSVEDCRIIVGGHYDTVRAGPGANDNASGTAVAIELASHYIRPGLCFVAFGAEEIGLFGSRAFVSDHRLDGVTDVLNIDMAGKIDEAIIVGDPGLTNRIIGWLDEADGDFPIAPGSFGPFASSDHVSFDNVGIPAVTINSSLDMGVIHTAQDDLDNIRMADLEVMLRIADIALRGLLLEADR